MAVSVSDFRDRFAEFAGSTPTDELVATCLAEALTEMDAAVWGAKLDLGQKYLAAHKLAMSPFGTQAGLRLGAGANQTSAYWPQYEDLRKRVGGAFRAVLE